MKIFFPSASPLLTDRLPHGEGLIAFNVLHGLALRGHELVVCCGEAQLDADPGFEVIELGRRSRWESIEPFAYARAVREIGRTQQSDVWHWLFPQEPEEVQVVAPRGTPLVLGPWPERWPGPRHVRRPGDVVRLLLEPVFARRNRQALQSGRVLAATPASARSLQTGTLVPFGVDAEKFRAEPVVPDGPVLFVGRLDRAKGVRELVDAFAQAGDDLPGVELVLAGDGPERAWIEARVAELGLHGRVRLLGRVPAHEVPGLLRSAALLCAPSHGEPYGMSILEAMAVGRPVVATDEGGPRFLLGDGDGTLVPVGDAGALARALMSLLGDPGRLAEAGRRNRERVEREFSLARMLDRLEDVYREVAA